MIHYLARMEFAYQVTLQDLMEFGQHVFRTSSQVRRKRRFWLIFAPTLFAALALEYYRERRAFDWLFFAIVSQVVCSAVFFPRFVDRVSMKQIYRSYITKPELGDTGAVRLVVADESLTEITATRRTKLEWTNICKAESLQNQLYIYCGLVTAIIIPRHGFEHDQTYQDLQAEVSKRVRITVG